MCSGIKGTQEAEALAAMRRAVPPGFVSLTSALLWIPFVRET